METEKPLPPDRSALVTEQRNPRTMDLHRLSVAECVERIQDEDRVIYEALAKARPALVAFIQDLVPKFKSGGRLIYIGAGTSGRLGVLDASEAPPTFQIEPGRIIGLIAGGDASLRRSSEGLEDDPFGAVPELSKLELGDRDTLLGIAAGGTTRYVLGALDYAHRLDPQPLTALLVCTPLLRPPAVNHYILIETGPEVLTGSTRMKAGTATKMALNTISTTLMIQSGRVYQNLMVDLKATNDKLRDRAARILGMLTGFSREASFDLLDRAGGSVKASVVMQRLGMELTEASSHLKKSGDRLDRALGEEYEA